MSLAICAERIYQVLLADGWHEVKKGSFYMDAYEYVNEEWFGRPDDAYVLHNGGGCDICARGFSFINKGVMIRGPLTSILAIKERKK